MDKLPLIRVVAAVIGDKGRYLITQRRPTAVLPLLWEFPGGRVEEGESDEDALRREIRHRLDVDLEVGKFISFTRKPYQSYAIDFYLYEGLITEGVPRARAVHTFKWVKYSEFGDHPFAPVDEESMSQLLGLNETSD